MSKSSTIISNLKSAASRFIRGLFLILWILGLSYVALGSLTGRLAKSLLETGTASNYLNLDARRIIPGSIRFSISKSVGSDETPEAQKCPKGDLLLSEFGSFKANLPPIEVLLDLILPNWTVSKSMSQDDCSKDKEQEIRQTYRRLFTRVTERLRSIARNDIDPKVVVVDTSFLPPEIKQQTDQMVPSAEFNLPPEIQDWVIRERQRLKKEDQALSLVGTFLLLGVMIFMGTQWLPYNKTEEWAKTFLQVTQSPLPSCIKNWQTFSSADGENGIKVINIIYPMFGKSARPPIGVLLPLFEAPST